jgi:hypothetical protein
MTGLFAPRDIGIGFMAAVAAIAAVYGYQTWSARSSSFPSVLPQASYPYAQQDDGGDEVFEDPLPEQPSLPERPPSPEVD